MPNSRGSFKTGGKSARQERRREAAQNREQARRWKALVRDRNKGVVVFDRDARWYEGGPASARLTVVRRQQLNRAMVDAARAGTCDPETARIVHAIAGFLNRCASFSPGGDYGFLCLCCESEFNATVAPEVVRLTTPLRMGAATLASGICAACARRSDAELPGRIAIISQMYGPACASWGNWNDRPRPAARANGSLSASASGSLHNALKTRKGA